MTTRKRRYKIGNMRWRDVVELFFPRITQKQYEYLLWPCTCYPAGTPNQVIDQLRDICIRSGGDADKAIEMSHQEFDDVWEATRPERELWETQNELYRVWNQIQTKLLPVLT